MCGCAISQDLKACYFPINASLSSPWWYIKKKLLYSLYMQFNDCIVLLHVAIPNKSSVRKALQILRASHMLFESTESLAENSYCRLLFHGLSSAISIKSHRLMDSVWVQAFLRKMALCVYNYWQHSILCWNKEVRFFYIPSDRLISSVANTTRSYNLKQQNSFISHNSSLRLVD